MSLVRSRGVGVSGSALMIVLAFLVIVSAVVVAHLGGATTHRKIASTGAAAARVEIFLGGAMDTVIHDLKEEIASGSEVTVVGVGALSSRRFRPLRPANAVPSLVGSTGTYGQENLIKRSQSGQAAYAGGEKRVSGISTAGRAPNGRWVSAARWNKPLLMPASSAEDWTPPAAVGFQVPDWIFVSQDGSNPLSWSKDLNAGSVTQREVIGRFAYMIYDEGGLLDVNVAGFPSTAPSVMANQKFSSVCADLTKLGVNALGVDGSLTPVQNDNLLGWRNYATAKPGRNGAGKYTFDPMATDAYFYAARTNATGYLSIGASGAYAGETDRMVVSRQQLIQLFLQKLGGGSRLLSALQFVGTFSRALNQPSFEPVPERPKIQSPGQQTADGMWDKSTYQGGNDAFGQDDKINPAILDCRVEEPFERNDGTMASAGEPLVKKRFDLRRLAWLTYKGPSSQRGTAGSDIQTLVNNGITANFLSQGTPENIYKYFGLIWDPSGFWIYGHGAPGGHLIGRLGDLRREPDFFELLKAGIVAGSIGKSAANGSAQNVSATYQHGIDISTEGQIVQIGANIIDQSDADGFPTRIQFNGREVVGCEDLPGLYRTNYSWVFQKAPNPLLSAAEEIRAVPSSASLKSAGNATLFLVPCIWNVHDQNDSVVRGVPSAAGEPRPAQLRIVASTAAPGMSDGWQIGMRMRREASGPVPQVDFPAAPEFHAMDGTNAVLTFTDAGGKLFHEPTKLWKTNIPEGSNLTSSGPVVADIHDKSDHVGFFIGSSPVEATCALSGSCYIIKPSSILVQSLTPAGAWFGEAGAMTFQMQYADEAGGWHDYDVKYWDYQANVFACTPGFSNSDPAANGQLYSPSGPAMGNDMIGWDPRSARFHMDKGESGPKSCLDFGGSTTNKGFCVVPTGRPSAACAGKTDHCGPAGLSAMFYDGMGFDVTTGNPGNSGMSEQNVPWAVAAGGFHQFYADPDGVVRRAMGAYVPVGAGGQTTSTIGLVQATATTFSGGVGSANPSQSASRPIVLNRPFRSVVELGYTFRGSPYKNIDFFTPESGDTALLDLFCVGDNSDADGLMAGRVNLNTRQPAALKALLSGAMLDELDLGSQATALEVQNMASALISRTSGIKPWQGPFCNISDLVGRFVGRNVAGVDPSSQVTQNVNGSVGANYYACNIEPPGSGWGSSGSTVTYAGFSADLDQTVFSSASHRLTAPSIQRLRQSAIRTLVDCGQTRVWNLMIDVIAQTGRCPKSATGLADFVVEGERRCWLHVAIDRCTGKILDRQLEIVTE